MQNEKRVTRAQTKFLRGFARNPNGPPADEWPSPVVLRRWLRRPGFCGAMNSILRAMRYRADFHLTAAAAGGANLLHGAVDAGDIEAARRQIDSLVHLLRLAHIRHRFAEPLPKPETTMSHFIAWLRTVHPDITVREALESRDILEAKAGEEHKPGWGAKLWGRTGHPASPRSLLPSPWREDWDEDEDEADEDGEGDSNGADGDYDDDSNTHFRMDDREHEADR